MTSWQEPEEEATLSMDEDDNFHSGVHFAIMMDSFQTLVRIGNDD